jgi:hypothetical protein
VTSKFEKGWGLVCMTDHLETTKLHYLMRISKSWLATTATVLFLAACALHFVVLKRYTRRATPPSDNEAKFYIYEWPPSITDAWPRNSSHHRISIHPQFRLNYGTGELVDATTGLHHTHQYSLFTLLYARLRGSSRRTTDPSKAAAFFVPYDLGMDATTRTSDGALARTNCPRVSTVMELLRESPYFKRSGGSDHFLLHSINQMMVFYANEACTQLYELCHNCSKLSIDTYPPGVFDYLDRHVFMSHRWLSIPFPSNYHHSNAVVAPPWNAVQRIPRYMEVLYDVERPYALCFVGSTMVTAKLQRLLRQELITTCRRYPQDCLYVSLASHESHQNIFQAGKSALKETSASASYNPYSKAKFCFAPGTLA